MYRITSVNSRYKTNDKLYRTMESHTIVYLKHNNGHLHFNIVCGIRRL